MMAAVKFEPHDNWLPPGFFTSDEIVTSEAARVIFEEEEKKVELALERDEVAVEKCTHPLSLFLYRMQIFYRFVFFV